MNLLINGKIFQVKVKESSQNGILFEVNNKNYYVELANNHFESDKTIDKPVSDITTDSYQNNVILADIPGLITSINIKPNQKIKAGDSILTLEAMKMQNRVVCFSDCEIQELCVSEGQEVSKGQILVKLK